MGPLPLDQLRALPRVREVVRYHSGDDGVYFLWGMAALLYVGKAVDVPYRVEQHRQCRLFSHATWVSLSGEYRRRALEGDYVRKYRRPLNRTRHG